MTEKKIKNKGFRDGLSKEKLLKSMSDEDWDMIKRQKELEQASPGSMTYKVLLQNDPIRRRIIKTKEHIHKRFADIKNADVRLGIIQQQITSGKIHDELKQGVLMTSDQLEVEIEYATNLKDSLAKDVVVSVAELRMNVGHYDATKTVIMTEDDFDEYVKEVEARLKTLGYELFDI